MKKRIRIILFMIFVLMISFYAAACPAAANEGPSAAANEEVPGITADADVLAVFAAQKKQPRAMLTTQKSNLDTIWILLTDGTFRQYVIMNDVLQMFSCGTYNRDEAQRALSSENAQDKDITVNRTYKHMEGAGLRRYSSVHTYILKSAEYAVLAVPNEENRKVKAVCASAAQPDRDRPDTYRIYYTDGTYEEFADTDNVMAFCGSGNYSIADWNGFSEQENPPDFEGRVLLLAG